MDRGYEFPAADHLLTDVYLAGEIAGRPVASTFIHRADVYSAVPEDLVSGRQCVRDRDGNDACYIISPVRFAGKKKTRKLRRIDGDPRKSYWHSESRTPLEGSKIGGYVLDCTHAIKTDGRTERQGWRMKEFGISTEHGDSDLVLCKVYRTPRNPSIVSASASTTAAAVPVYPDPTSSCKKRKVADGVHPGAPLPCARPRMTDYQPLMVPEPEIAHDELFRTCCPVIYDEKIRGLMPDAPDPKVDPEGYMKCLEELVKKTVAEASPELKARLHQKKARWPEPEMDIAAPPPSSFFEGVEQEFPWLYPSEFVVPEEAPPAAQPEPEREMEQEFLFLYPNNNNGAVTEEAQPEEDVGMIRRCSDDVMMPWPSFTHMMMH